MTVNLGNPMWLTLVTDAATPPDLAQYAGRIIGIPEGTNLPTHGQLDTIIVSGVSVPGYARAGGGTGVEWVMQGALDPIVAALEAIPGGDGWQSPAAKALFQNIGGALLAAGVSLPDARTALTQLYNGAVSNFVAAHPQA